MAELLWCKINGEKIVFTNGCFDLLHSGHLTLLYFAKSLGDRLIVGVNSNSSVRWLKGKGRPINTLEDRVAILQSLKPVDFVMSFSERTPIKLIEEIKPNFLVKGSEWENNVVGADFVAGYGGEVVLLKRNGMSTTSIVAKIKEETHI